MKIPYPYPGTFHGDLIALFQNHLGFIVFIIFILAIISYMTKKIIFDDRKKALEMMSKSDGQDKTIQWLIEKKSFSINEKIIENVQLINTHGLDCFVTTEKIFFYEMDNCIYAGGYCIFNQYFDSWEIDENHIEITVRDYIIRIPFQKEWEGYEPYILNSKYS